MSLHARPGDYDRLTEAIYAGVCDDDAFLTALRCIAEYFGCASAVLVYADRAWPGADIALTYGPFGRPEVQSRYLLYAADDPAPQAMARLSVGEASTTSRLFTPAFLATSRFLHEFYRPLGFEETLGGPVIDLDGQTGILAVHRGRDRDTFDDAELETFGRLTRHFSQALKLRRNFFTVEKGRQALAVAFEAAGTGMVVLDAAGVMSHANIRARRVLARNDGLSLTRTGQVRLRDPEADHRLQNGLRTLLEPAVLQARREGGLSPYLLRLHKSEATVADAPRILSIFDPEHRPMNAEATLRAAFGISRRPAAMVVALLSGDSLADYASAKGISRNTAKFHLQAAFLATGTSRQVDLINRAAAVVHGLSGDDENTNTP